MDFEDFEDFENTEDFHDDDLEAFNRLIESYEKSYKTGKYSFYDLDEFQSLIEYYTMKNEYDKMNYALKNADEIYPNHPLFHLVRAFIAIYDDKEDIALEWLEKADKALESSDYDMSIFLQKRAEIYAELGDYFKSLQDLGESLRFDNPEKDFILDQMEDLYLVLFNFELGEDKKHPIPLFVEDIYSYLYDDNYLFVINHYPEQALKILEYLVREQPLDDRIWFYYGLTQKANQYLSEALSSFDFSLALRPDFILSSFYKAQVFRELGEYEKAIKTLVNINFSEDQSGLIYYELAENFTELIRYEEASKYYKLSIAKDNRTADSYYGLARIYAFFFEDSTSAISYIKKAIDIDETSPLYQLLYADILSLQGKYVEAEKIYKKSLEINPDFSEAWLNYADIYAKQNQFDKAIDILDSQLDSDFINGSLFARRFNYLWKSGRKQEAFDNLKTLLYSAEETVHEIFEYDKNLVSDPELLRYVNDETDSDDDAVEDED